MMEGFWQDLRHGTRMLLKNPGFTIVAMLSIAIGVGANAAMFSLADGLVLRPVQVPRASEIVSVGTIAPRAGTAVFNVNRGVSYRDYVDLRDRAQSFSGLTAHRVLITSFATSRDDLAQRALGLAVSGNFFTVLELQPEAGRFFLPDEDRVPGRDAVIVLAHKTWADQFGSDPSILDRRVRLGGVDFRVIGVAPASFTGMQLVLPPAYYVPLAMMPSLAGMPAGLLDNRNARMLDVRGRLKPDVSLEQTRQETRIIAEGLEREYPDSNRGYGMLVITAFAARLEERGPSAPSAFALLTLAFVVLLVACANVAGLLMSRAPARQREIALRLAIGGGRLRVSRQLVTESLLLAAGGGALGLLLAYGGVLFIQRLPIVSDIGVQLAFELDRRTIAVGLVLAALSALVSSIVPAWRATHTDDLAHTLIGGTGNVGRIGRLWGRNGLVVGQVALSVVLLTVTVFLSRTFQAELQQPGFRTSHLLLSTFEPGLARYDDGRADAFYRLLKERVRAIPGVTAAGMTSVMPLNQDNRDFAAIVPDGVQLPQGTQSLTTLLARIDEGYLETIDIAVLRGRGIRGSDTADTPRVLLVNEAMAARYWPGQDPIGRRIRLVDRPGQPWAEVVGMTANSKYNWIGEGPTPWMYMAQRQDPGALSTLIIASTSEAAALASPLRQVVRDLDPNMPISGVRTMEEFYYGNATGLVSRLVQIVGSLGVMGLVLATVGLYGLVAYAAARRSREIGIRIAIGARPASVLRMVLGHGLMLAVVGVVIGGIGSVAAGGLLRSAFPNSGGIDATTFLLVIPALVGVTLLAAYIPARRAARIDPLVALKLEQ